MSSHEAFLQAILEDPDDDTPRLVYADWLDEHGDPDRGEFIRVQCERARLPADDPRQSELQARERRLFILHLRAWAAGARAWPGGLADVRFRRGFVEQLRHWEPETFVEQADGTLAAHPVRDVEILPAEAHRQGWGEALADCPSLGRLHTLRIRAHPADLLAVCRSPHLAALHSLSLHNNPWTGDATLAELVGAGSSPLPAALRTLRSLVLQHNSLTDEGVIALAASPLARTLTGLVLSVNWGITLDGLRSLCNSPLWPRLEELGLRDISRVRKDTRPLLADTLPRSRIRRLDLSGYPRVGVRGHRGHRVAESLASASSWGPLRALNLSMGRIGSQGLRALLGCPHVGQLTWLDLCRCDLTTDDAVLLADCPRLRRLTVLKLAGNQIGDRGVEALVASPHLRHLVYLNLRGTGVTSVGVSALARSPNSANLRVLNLYFNGAGPGIGDAGLKALADSPFLGRLTSLYLNVVPGVTAGGVTALATSPHLRCLTFLNLHVHGLSAEGQRALLKAKQIAWPGLERHDLATESLRRSYRRRFGPVRAGDWDWDEPFFSWEV
jgi:uncharacterized protein (TIGR02996 family)